MFYRAIALLCLCIGALSDETTSPRIVIVGAGSSGIGAAARLIENGLDNVLLLEAEDRIGGRVCTVPLGKYVVDLGAQWVHGQVGNIAYELAAPLGLLDRSPLEYQFADFYTSSGDLYNPVISDGMFALYRETQGNSTDLPDINSLGDFYEKLIFKKFFDEHPEVNEADQKALLWFFHILQLGLDPALDWHEVSSKDSDYQDCEGELTINWKERGYSTILDILMKKIPNPEEELPVMNKTILNSEVAKVDYTSEDGPIKVTTVDGKEYLADHVIMTPSLGVLKAQYETLFDPPLPEEKVKNIKGLGFGSAGKIILEFSEPWWGEKPKDKAGFMLLWNEKERKEYESDPLKKWLLGATGFLFVSYKPNLLQIWLSAEGANEVESIDDEIVMNQIMTVMNRFLSRDYNVTRPIGLKRSKWFTNKHFRGTYTYRSLETDKTNSSAEQLSQPIMKKDKPVVLFAGEATHKHHFGTVQGGIGSGRREADRLINLYKKDKSPNGDSPP